jgi:sulfite reductase alpha subunit-like flavoprotein
VQILYAITKKVFFFFFFFHASFITLYSIYNFRKVSRLAKSIWFPTWEVCSPFWKKIFLYLRTKETFVCDGNVNSNKENIQAVTALKDFNDVIVTFGSQTGTAQHYAKHIVNTLSTNGPLNYFLKDLSDIDFNTFCYKPSKCLWIFCLATHGDGEPSDNAYEFFRHLSKANKNKVNLTHILYTVLGFGNREYEKFNAAAITLEKKLKRLGAKLFCNVGVADDFGDSELDVYRWVENILVPSITLNLQSRVSLPHANLKLSAVENGAIINSHTTSSSNLPISPCPIVTYGSFISHKFSLSMAEKTFHFEPENMIAKFYSSCYGFRIETSEELLLDASKANTPSVKHITFNLTRMYDKDKIFESSDDMIEKLVPEAYCPWIYSAGQTVEVITENASVEVNWWFQRVFKESGLSPNDHLCFKSMPLGYKLPFPPNSTISSILKYFCDFTSVASRDFLKNMLYFVQDEREKQILKQLLIDEFYLFYIFEPMLNLRQVFTLFGTSACFTKTPKYYDVLKFLSIVPRKKPRPYSISSSYTVDHPCLSLTVAQFVSKTNDRVHIFFSRLSFFFHVLFLFNELQKIKKLPSLLELQNQVKKKHGFACYADLSSANFENFKNSEMRYFYGDVSSKLCSSDISRSEPVLLSLNLMNPLKKMSLKSPILLIACGTGIAPCRSIWREIDSLYKAGKILKNYY